MKAGELHEKIQIRRIGDPVVNQFGDVTHTETVLYDSVRCNILHLGTPSAGASEFSDDDQEVGEMKAEFKTRWISGIKFTDIIIWNGGRFDIYSILPIGRREGMRLRGRRRDNLNDSNPNT